MNKVVQEIGTKVYQEAAAKQQASDKGKNEDSNDKDNVVDAEFKEKK